MTILAWGLISKSKPVHRRATSPGRPAPAAATIAAGLHGLTSKLKAPKLYEGNAYADATLPQVPKTLREAIGELERSKVARAALGDRVIDHYLHTARLEQMPLAYYQARRTGDARRSNCGNG